MPESAARDKTAGNALRVAIADDHRLMLDGIRRALEAAPDIRVVGEAMSGREVLAMVPQVAPDVLVMDLRMPEGDGITTLSALREAHPDLKVIILSMFEDDEHIKQSLQRGAAGYVVKSINPLDLPSAIRQVMEGAVHFPRGGQAMLTTSAPGATPASPSPTLGVLTDRELSILQLVAAGLSNHDIATKLFVTDQTVKFHLSNVYRKLKVANRTEAARLAYDCGLAG